MNLYASSGFVVMAELAQLLVLEVQGSLRSPAATADERYLLGVTTVTTRWKTPRKCWGEYLVALAAVVLVATPQRRYEKGVLCSDRPFDGHRRGNGNRGGVGRTREDEVPEHVRHAGASCRYGQRWYAPCGRKKRQRRTGRRQRALVKQSSQDKPRNKH